MPKTVVKFGGSNLKCKEDIGRVIQVVKNYEQPVVIVVSAFYGVTNYLIESLEKARHDEYIATKTTDFLFNLKKETLQLHILDSDLINSILSEIRELLDELGKLLQGIALTGDASKALEDHVLALGSGFLRFFSPEFLTTRVLIQRLLFPKQSD